MVRVISVHHFANQHVQVIEQPTACTVAPPNRLLSALMSNCIEVRDLDNESEIMFSFPTVDEVIQMVHCVNGDYVATLETKFNRQNREINFVRIYINWDSVATLQQSKMTNSGISLGLSECGMVQPMRARIAGRVTPTTNQSELGSLEMIEIPVKRNPNFIDCCQVSGNILVLSDKIINIYTFLIKTHDISKMRFVDFDEIPLLINIPFMPLHVSLCENYIACMNKDSVILFKISETHKKENHDLNSSGEDDFSFIYTDSSPLDYKKILREEMMNNRRGKVIVNLPSIVKDNSLIHKNNPFTFSDKDMIVNIQYTAPIESKSTNYSIEHLIQLKLIPIVIESAQRQVTEEFKSFILKPLYINQNLNRSPSVKENRFLGSDFSECLNSVVCMISTQQEAYLYYFNDTDPCTDKDNCLAVYPFTAPVFKLVMDDYFLHALTETGLESYTLRHGHQMCRNIEVVDNVNVACPPLSDPICLVGLRPFLGVEQLLLAERHLVLLAAGEPSPARSASSDGGSSSAAPAALTLYGLGLPTPRAVFEDVRAAADAHRFTSARTYRHLVGEAHMVLRMALTAAVWESEGGALRQVAPRAAKSDGVADAYRASCALLADHFVMCNNEEDYTLAIPYYKMARVQPVEVLRRVKKVQEQSGNQSTKGLMHYLKRVLLQVRSGLDADRIFGSSSRENFSESILDLLESDGYRDLPNLILKSKIIREYSTDKLINILTERLPDNYTNMAERHLALTILYIQKCNSNLATANLDRISRESLCQLVLENHDLLLETTYSRQNKSKGVTTFSELTVLLISYCPELLSSLFVNLMMDKKVINLNKIIRVFLEYLPSSIGNDSSSASSVLQQMLEMYFGRYFSKPENIDLTKIVYERGASEAMKLLVRSYLSQLQIIQLREEQNKQSGKTVGPTKEENSIFDDLDDDTIKDKHQEKLGYNRINNIYFDEKIKKPEGSYLFSGLRHEYLDKMPPFQIEMTSKLYETCLENYSAKEQYSPNEEIDLVLRKLQALLCSQVVPKQVITEVNGYLSVNEFLRGNASLYSITMVTNDAVLLLIDACPQCLLQFGKDRFSKTDEWKFLIATVQRKILRLSQNEKLKRVCLFHRKILKDILTFVSSTLTLDQLVQVFPQRFSTTQEGATGDCHSETHPDLLKDIQNYEPYIVICKETMHANQISKLITTTGQQLLCTLNL